MFTSLNIQNAPVDQQPVVPVRHVVFIAPRPDAVDFDQPALVSRGKRFQQVQRKVRL